MQHENIRDMAKSRRLVPLLTSHCKVWYYTHEVECPHLTSLIGSRRIHLPCQRHDKIELAGRCTNELLESQTFTASAAPVRRNPWPHRLRASGTTRRDTYRPGRGPLLVSLPPRIAE